MARCPNCRRPINKGDQVCDFCDEPINVEKDVQETGASQGTHQERKQKQPPQTGRSSRESSSKQKRTTEYSNSSSRARQDKTVSSKNTQSATGQSGQRRAGDNYSGQQTRQGISTSRQASEKRGRQQEGIGESRSSTNVGQQGGTHSNDRRADEAWYEPTDRNPPRGVKIVCAIMGLGAISSILLGVSLLDVASDPRAAGWVGTLAWATILIAIINFPVIYGLWNLKSWALIITIGLYLVNVVSGLWLLFNGIPTGIITIGVAVVIIAYLYTKREFFDIDETFSQSGLDVGQGAANPSAGRRDSQAGHGRQREQQRGNQPRQAPRQQRQNQSQPPSHNQGSKAAGAAMGTASAATGIMGTIASATSGAFASILLGLIWMSLISLLLFWVPVFGPLIAGYVGGKKAGGVINASLAALLPAIAIAGVAFTGGLIADIPLLGAVLGGAAFLIVAVHAFPLLCGGIIGGALAN